jgi:prepilin-type processing-associated H-X9-DG protein
MDTSTNTGKIHNKIAVYSICSTAVAIVSFAVLLFVAPIAHMRDFFIQFLLILSTTATVGGIGLGIAGFIDTLGSKNKTKGIGLAIISVLVSGLTLYVLIAPKGCRYPASPIMCMANLKHLGIVMQLYAKENSGKLPSATNWCDMVLPYELSDSQNRKGHFTCPEVKSGIRVCTYAMNEQISGMKIAEVDPNTILLFETDAGWNQHGGAELLRLREHRTGRLLCNILFADGHVERVFEKDIPTLRWKP